MKLMLALGTACVLLCLAACATAGNGAPLPPGVQARVDSLNAGGQVSAAQTLAVQYQSTVTIATAFANETRRIEFANATADAKVSIAKTETASARVTADHQAAIAKTEVANAQATADAKTADAKTEAAHARSTDFAIASTNATVSARASETAQAQVNASATYVAEAPTRVAIARIQANEQAQQEFERALARAYQRFSLRLAPYIGAARAVFDQLALPCFLSALTLVFLFAVVKGILALLRLLDARTLEKKNTALQKRLITDTSGHPVGFIQQTRDGNYIVERLAPPGLAEGTETKTLPPANGSNVEVGEGDPLLLDGLIHYTSLLTFTRAIMESGDWTQATWAERQLPRGFRLTKDFKDGAGNNVPGNYSRLLQLFVDKQLIVGRRAGSSGRWNPHAPRDVEAVMAILYGEVAIPPLPEPMQAPAGSKRKPTGKPILTAN